MKKHTFKLAFTMIELIFAIVIIAITVLSLPMMTQVTSKGIENNLVQEAIFAASTKINETVSYYWDENSLESGKYLSNVVSVAPSDCNETTKLRSGHINQPLHRRCIDDTTLRPSTTLGSDSADLDDIDDVHGSTTNIFTSTTTSASGYKKNYNVTTSVSYASFGTEASTTNNIKKIEVTVTDSSSNTITKLNTYVSNIGEIDYLKRSFQ